MPIPPPRAKVRADGRHASSPLDIERNEGRALQPPRYGIEFVDDARAGGVDAAHEFNRAAGMVMRSASTVRTLPPPHYGIDLVDRLSAAGEDTEQQAERAADAVMSNAPAAGAPPAERPDARAPDMPRLRGASLPAVAMRPLPADAARPHGALSRDAVPASVNATLGASGRPLDDGVRRLMETRFGHDLSGVRVHTGAAAGDSAAEIGALAYASGQSIAFGHGQYVPGSQSGLRLLAHELAHVVQQGGTRPEAPVMRFEAPIHEAAERVGLTTDAAGASGTGTLTNEEASAVYFGNWMRDVNQIFVPLVGSIVPNDVVFSLVSYMAATKFGRSLSPEQFGYYIPSEHLDSPGGLVDEDDLLLEPPKVPVAGTATKMPERPPEFVTPQEKVTPGGKVAGAPIFSVDQAGVIAYLRRSNLHIERRLELAARIGRNPEGMMHFGAALHAVEDLFAHSNWVEIAVNHLLATRPELLPELAGPARAAYTFGASVALPGQPANAAKRPVLMTGSFTSTDTQVSITSEVVNFMNKPLPEPKSDAEAKTQEQFVSAMLGALEGQLGSNKKFRETLRDAIRDSIPAYFPLREWIANQAVTAPLVKLYQISTWMPPVIPEPVRQRTTDQVKILIHEQISEQGLQPMGRRIAAEAQGTRIADTSLLKVLEDSKRQATGKMTDAELAAMKGKHKLGAPTVEKQTEETAKPSGRRADALQATPLPTVAGPSHSQIAKDHVNSPFFGLGFHVGSVAVRLLREKMVPAWSEGGRGSQPYDFASAAFAGSPDDKKLFLAGRARRTDEETKSLRRGQRVVAQGNDAAAPYDLVAMRKDAAQQMHAVAEAMRTIATAPDKAGGLLNTMSKLMGGLESEKVARVQAELAAAAEASKAAGAKMRANVSLEQVADKIDAHAAVIEKAASHSERETANATLVSLRNEGLMALAARPSVNGTLSSAVLLLLDQQVSATAVAYTTRQRRVLEGTEAAPEHTGSRNYAVQNVTLPDISNRSPAVRDLLAESRRLFNHPYESDWWRATVTEHIKSHAKQIATDIEARNAAVPFYTRPGEVHGHEH